MPNLEQLKLNFIELDDGAIGSLSAYPNLSHIELDRTGLTDDGLRTLLHLNPQLRRIEIRGTLVTRATVAELAALHPDCEFVLE